MSENFNVPILITTFNRPDTLAVLMQQIRLIKPSRLYISSDAAREDQPGEQELVDKCRTIATNLDWDCEIKTLFRDKNLGMKHAMHQGISWFFDNEAEGIILEDDCIPNQSFFRYCRELLKHYRDDPRIMHIAGTNQQFGQKIGNASYYFSAFPPIWGWASWRRVWNLYDIEMKMLPEMEEQQVLKNIFPDAVVVKELYRALRLTYEKVNLTWDHQLGVTIVANNGLCIVPNVNLVSNLGVKKVGEKQLESVVSNIPTVEMEEPIIHPQFFIPNRKADLNHISWSYEDTTKDKKVMFQRKNKSFSFSKLFQVITNKLSGVRHTK